MKPGPVQYLSSCLQLLLTVAHYRQFLWPLSATRRKAKREIFKHPACPASRVLTTLPIRYGRTLPQLPIAFQYEM